MQIKKEYKIKNKLGIFKIIPQEEIKFKSYFDIKNVTNIKIEFYDNSWFSIYDEKSKDYIYMINNEYFETPKCYKCKITESEKPIADFTRKEK